ncbi:uncharacterized protein LOC133736097 [Rosa rugosa]|uniref:uncharacterized protein LOC133736097 n=1 Tax=Rosa rugosa TaxID=74645 RepID=UPI002B407019|nr:uncharacterized protein LOC133736097 [Rosa rugosa]
MRGFREALSYSELIDLGFQGAKMTWWNSETQLWLDRAVATASWSDVFGFSRVKHLAPSDSDHTPILLQASSVPLPKRPRRHRFKFESFWLQHEECDPLVLEKWQTDFEGVPMFALTRKIMCTRRALESWQQQTFRFRQQQMIEVQGRLEFLMGEQLTVELHEENKTLMASLQDLLSQEEAFWKQRAKVIWLQEGDRNSGFFHQKAANRKRKNALLGLFDADGIWRDDDDGMESVVTSYFSKMFTSSALDSEAVDLTLAAIQPCVTAEMNKQLCEQYTEEEVRCALFQMYPTKSPGPDGMPPLFFQHYWDSIGKDVIAAVQSFLHTGLLLKQINFTHVCLIPKVKNPETMGDLRPIALCNVIYKLCSKVIANRLKVFLPSLISSFQSAFVPGRLITDNILVANEVAHFVHNKRAGQDGYMARKLDLSKAYDRMEWAILRKVLVRFGFAQNWIDVVMQCVTSVRYSFLVRGKPRGYVIPSRGLRQGDPLSPYLFLFGLEGFSALLQQKQRLGLLPGIAICQNPPRVNHLLFADDSMLYAQATPEACFHFKHRGDQSPTYVGRKKTATFEYIKERLGEKLKLWQGKLLSGAGKDILIRVVAQALPNYAMSVFQLTKKICEDLEQMCARFWWGSSSDKRKIHWKKWDDLCHAKEVGGLGFRSLSEFNMSMLAKQAWRVISNPESLVAQLYKARYYPDGNFWNADAHATPSYSWRSLFATREFIQTGAFWQVGTGHNVSVWNDAWIPKLPSHKPQVALVSQPDVQTVNELIIPPNNWDEHKVRSIFVPDEAAAILSIPLTTRQPEDRLTWHLEKKGMFTVKSAYRSAKMPSSAKVTAWKICHNILPAMDRLDSRHVELESQVCVLCNVETETIIHICRNCTFTRDVFSSNASIMGCCLGSATDELDALSWLHYCSDKLSKTTFTRLLFLIWGIWKERNARVWDHKITSACDIALMSTSRLSNFIFHNSKVQRVQGVGRHMKWKAPPQGWVKLNFDGAYNVGTGRAAVGFLEAVSFAVEQALQPIIFETDCLVVQQQLAHRDVQNTSMLGRLYDDVNAELQIMTSSRLVYTRREANKDAHTLAAYAAAQDQNFFFSSSPSFIQYVIDAEKHDVP